MPSDVIKQDRNGVVQFILGFFFGAVIFVVVAAAATFFLQGHHYCAGNRFSTGLTNCMPAFQFALLRAASWGPASILSMAQPSIHLREIQWQLISGGLFGIIAGVLFIFQSRRSPMEIFLIIYLLLTVFTAFIVLMLITAG